MGIPSERHAPATPVRLGDKNMIKDMFLLGILSLTLTAISIINPISTQFLLFLSIAYFGLGLVGILAKDKH
jgi:hypothetical protein